MLGGNSEHGSCGFTSQQGLIKNQLIKAEWQSVVSDKNINIVIGEKQVHYLRNTILNSITLIKMHRIY